MPATLNQPPIPGTNEKPFNGARGVSPPPAQPAPPTPNNEVVRGGGERTLKPSSP